MMHESFTIIVESGIVRESWWMHICMETNKSLEKNKGLIFLILKILIMLFVIIFLIGLFLVKETGKRDELDDWLGMYGYFEAFEHIDGVVNYTVNYEIIIYKDEQTYYAELRGNGWFLQTRSLAYVEGDENSINIIFKQTLPGDYLYGRVERYEKDELLITLTYEKSELISSWYALQHEYPVWWDSEEPMKGIYFTKRYS